MVKSKKQKEPKQKNKKHRCRSKNRPLKIVYSCKTLLSLSFGFVRLSATLCILQLQCLLKKQYHAWEMLKLYCPYT